MSYKIRHLVIENNKQAQEEFSKIKATPQGINIMSSKLLTFVLKIKDVDNRAVNILKQEMLSRMVRLLLVGNHYPLVRGNQI